jgi:hypothetical protein
MYDDAPLLMILALTEAVAEQLDRSRLSSDLAAIKHRNLVQGRPETARAISAMVIALHLAHDDE